MILISLLAGFIAYAIADEISKEIKEKAGDYSFESVTGNSSEDFQQVIGSFFSALVMVFGMSLSFKLIPPMGTNDYYALLLNFAIFAFLFTSIALAWIDLKTLILPSALIYSGGGITLAILLSAVAVSGNWALLISMVFHGAAWFILYGLIWFWAPQGLGFGDVRLSFFIGAFLGFLNPAASVIGFIFAWILPAVVQMTMTGFGKIESNKPFPLGPWMLLAGFIGLYTAMPIVNSIVG